MFAESSPLLILRSPRISLPSPRYLLSLDARSQYAAFVTGTRLDKWLWAARFFKTRTLAAKACELNRVEANQQPARSSRVVRVGDLLSIKTEGGDFEVEVLGLSDVRGPAAIAQQLYRETEASQEARRKFVEERKAGLHFTPAPAGRPSKRDRRRIHSFRGDF
jgi:ribosome-associated heat shock protein Hsp15